MKLSIVVPDSAVYVDSVAYSDLSLIGIPLNVRALQWQDTTGHIEFNDNTPNEIIKELPLWVSDCLVEWEIANANELELLAELNQPIIESLIIHTDQEKLASIRLQRDKRLLDCDWTQLSDTPASINKEAWAAYRQSLRDLPNQPDLNLDIPNWAIPPSN